MAKTPTLLLILRILFCLQTFFGILSSIYVSINGSGIFSIILEWIQMFSNAAVVYFLFTRRRISIRIIKGLFVILLLLALTSFIEKIYQLIVFTSEMEEELKYFLVENRPMKLLSKELLAVAHCCSLSEVENSNDYFHLFQQKFPESCGKIQRENALPCDRLFSRQLTLKIIATVIASAIRPLILFFLWRYIRDVYKNDSNSVDQSNDVNEKATK